MIKIGICGFGKAIEEFHIPYIKNSKKFRIGSVFDITPARLDKAKKEIDTRVCSDYEEFLKSGIDLVIIATPSNFHYEYAVKTIDTGINLVIEKPMALTARDCDELIEKAQAKKVLLTVHHNRRWDGDFLAVKKAFNDGRLGKILSIASRVMNYGALQGYSVPEFDPDWRYKKGFGGGQLYDFGSHLIDQVLDLVKETPVNIKCELKKELWSKETDTYFKLDLEFKNRLTVEIIASQISKEQLPRWEIRGEKGSLVYEAGDRALKLKINEREEVVDIGQPQYYRFYDNIYNVLTKGEELAIKPEQARNVVAVIERAYKKDKSGPIV